MMAGYGKRHEYSSVFLVEFSGFDRRKIIRFVLIGMNCKMSKGDPRNTRNRIGIWRRKLILFRKHAMVVAILSLIGDIGFIKGGEAVVKFRPHQRKGLVVIMK